jgi:hypothetical protein
VRTARSWAFAAGLLGLTPAALALADPATAIPLGNWVRVTTATEVTGEGFAMGRESRGKALSNDRQTRTFEVNGHSVRVAKPLTTIEGVVEVADETTLLLRGSSPIAIPRQAITRLDLRRRESRKGAGVFIGALAGGAIGYGIGAATSGPGCKGGETGFGHLCSLDDVAKPVDAFLGAAGGAILGLVLAPGTRWQKNVPLDHVQVSLGPTRGRGILLSVSLAF